MQEIFRENSFACFFFKIDGNGLKTCRKISLSKIMNYPEFKPEKRKKVTNLTSFGLNGSLEC
ncbi:hypothetical protein B0E43_14850 [Algoriphagus sp. A40]|nr:hypothetical protein B0E43_14850 [Algoriphagus sp. A40]